MIAVFLDIETTGLDFRLHVPIDFALQGMNLRSNETLGVYQTVIKQSKEAWSHRDPISMEVNGYLWEQVQEGKEVAQVRKEVIDLLSGWGVKRGNAVFICQNPAFDRSFFSQIVPIYIQERLNWPYHWLDLASMYWTVYFKKLKDEGLSVPEWMSLSKNSIANAFQLAPEENPHKAINGVKHLIRCYGSVMEDDHSLSLKTEGDTGKSI